MCLILQLLKLLFDNNQHQSWDASVKIFISGIFPTPRDDLYVNLNAMKQDSIFQYMKLIYTFTDVLSGVNTTLKSPLHTRAPINFCSCGIAAGQSSQGHAGVTIPACPDLGQPEATIDPAVCLIQQQNSLSDIEILEIREDLSVVVTNSKIYYFSSNYNFFVVNY